jgi:uncharacterized membrane protein (UPF0127 family)
MIVKNITRNTIISKDLEIAKSLFQRFFGLLDKGNPSSLLFKTRFGIHTFGINYPIDVMVVGKSNKVTVLKSVNPYNIFIYNPKFNLVLELPHGSIKRSNTRLGDRIKIV